jgi:hypothetical protein
LIREVQRVLVWIVIAGSFAVALYPVVNWIERHVPWCRRSLVTLVVCLLLVALIGGLITLFVVPLAREGTALSHQLPAFIGEARAGRGPSRAPGLITLRDLVALPLQIPIAGPGTLGRRVSHCRVRTQILRTRRGAARAALDSDAPRQDPAPAGRTGGTGGTGRQVKAGI